MNKHSRTKRRIRAGLAGIGMALIASAAAAQGLVELYEAALRTNPNLKSREADVERARAESDVIGSQLRPQAAAQAQVTTNEYRESGVDHSYGGKRASLNLRQSLYEPSTRLRHEASRSSVQQREQELALTRHALFTELLDRYLQALAAQDQIDALAAETKAAAQHVDRLRVMRERQMAKVTDLAEAEAYAQGLVTSTIDARNARETALARLSELTGLGVDKVPPLVRSRFEPVPGAAPEWVEAARSANPRLRALQGAVDAARQVIEANRAERWPRVAATLSHTYADQGFDNRQQPSYNTTSLGVELRVPLYEGGRQDAAVREAVARAAAAEAELEAARREVGRETLTRWLGARADHARIDSTSAEVVALEQTVDAQEKGLELGVSRVTDLLDARRRLLRSRADQSKARYDFVRGVVALHIARGELAMTDVAGWAGWFDRPAR